jgi:membrane fusion protein, macrolide-specific efflux system
MAACSATRSKVRDVTRCSTQKAEAAREVRQHPTPERHEIARPTRWLTKSKVLATIAALVLAGAGVGTYLAVSGKPSAAASPITVSDENVTVSAGTMEQTVSASGTLEPAEDSDLTFSVSGTVNKVYVTTGQKVVAGQALATIDSNALADDVNAAEATVTSDEDRLTTDTDDGASTSTIDSDEAQVTSAESQLSSARTDLTDATLKATFSGTIASVDLSVGMVVSGSESSTDGSGEDDPSSSNDSSSNSNTSSTGSDSNSDSSGDGITVISTSRFTLSTSVDDTEVGDVKVGDQVAITPSDSATQIHGTVESVSLIASSTDDSSVASFPVVIDVTGSPTGVYAGDSATAAIIVKEVRNAVELPTAAISYQTGTAAVTEVVGGSDETVDVTTGISANGETQITSGLKAGDVVVERVVKFNTSAGAGKSLFGGGSSNERREFTGGPPSGGGFGGGGYGGSGGDSVGEGDGQ